MLKMAKRMLTALLRLFEEEPGADELAEAEAEAYVWRYLKACGQ